MQAAQHTMRRIGLILPPHFFDEAVRHLLTLAR
jgi:hypothetical protein